jgi:hypothetical protein
MTVQTFRDLLKKQPFQPFRIVLSSGQHYDIPHPEMAFLTKTDLIVGTGVLDDTAPETYRICSLLHITAVEPMTKKMRMKA